MEIFTLHRLPEPKINPMARLSSPPSVVLMGTIPIRILYPSYGKEKRASGEAAALIYFHGGGYSVGNVEEFENGLRIVAEESGCQVLISLISFKVKGTETLTAGPHGVAGYAIDYRLAAEFRSLPTRRVLYRDRLAAGRPLLR
jgi:hypothetical protein